MSQQLADGGSRPGGTHKSSPFKPKPKSKLGSSFKKKGNTPKKTPSKGTGKIGKSLGNKSMGVGAAAALGAGMGATSKSKPKITTVSGSSGGSSGGGSSRSSGGYSSSGYSGGYSSRSGGGSRYRSSGSRSSGGGGSKSDPYLTLQERQFEEDKRRYELERKEEATRREQELARARTEAKASLESQLALINKSIQQDKSRFKSDKQDWLGRGQEGVAELNRIYGSLLSDTQSGNQAALANLGGHQESAMSGAQSLIDSITGRNQETQAGLSQMLEQMGMSKALGVDQARSSEALGLSEILAQGQMQRTGADFGMMQGAQEAIGKWNETGIGTDKNRGVQDVNRQVTDMIGQLQRALQESLQGSQQDKLKAQGDYDSFIRGLAELTGSGLPPIKKKSSSKKKTTTKKK